MILLLLGLALWIGAHVFKRLAPERRAAMGEKGKGPVAIAIVAGILLMIVGYRWAAFVPVYDPPSWGRHANNLLVLIGFYLFAVSGAKSRLHRHIRHPQLTGFGLWAFAHLLANGDLASVILFGGLLAWAGLEIVLINRAVPVWTPPPVAPMRKEVSAVVITLVLFGVAALVHIWLGYNPFG
jgi:uncharacterized membrane protein